MPPPSPPAAPGAQCITPRLRTPSWPAPSGCAPNRRRCGWKPASVAGSSATGRPRRCWPAPASCAAAPARSCGPPHRRRDAQNAGPRGGVDRRLLLGAGTPSGLRAVPRRAGDRAVPDAALPARAWSRCSAHWSWIPSCRWRPRCTCSWATPGPSWRARRAAAEQYERALRIEPRNQEALDHLAPARFGQRPYEDALALYRTLLEINPDHALTHSNVGAALLHLARPQEALQSIERALALAPDLESPASASPRCASSLTSRDSNRRARGGTAHCRSPAAEPAAPWTAASAARRRDEPALC